MPLRVQRRKYKGFVPAAGFGSRLAPITHKIPKPLLPFLGLAVLDLALHKLTMAGIAVDNIAVNAHHLRDAIESHIKNHPFLSLVNLSMETEILGTGGGLNALHDWIGDDDLVIYNGDIVSDIAIADAIAVHEKLSSLATLVVLPTALAGKNPLFCKFNTLVSIGEKPAGYVGDLTEHTFTGVHILSNAFIRNHIPLNDYWHITDIYRATLAANLPISCHLHSGCWYDIGTPWDYFHTQTSFLGNPSLLMKPELGFQELQRKLHGNLEPIIVGDRCQERQIRGPAFIAQGIELCPSWQIEPNSILLSQPNPVSGLYFKNCLVFGQVQLEPHAIIENQIIYGKECLHLAVEQPYLTIPDA